MTTKNWFGGKHREYKWLLLVLLAPLAVFLQLGGHEFLGYDDPSNIYQNPHLVDFSLDNLLYFWQGPYLRLYIPLTYNFWLLLAKLSQLLNSADGTPTNPHLFHLANLLVHLGATTLLFLILRELLDNVRAAAVGAVLFAIHPLQVEPVAWASAMKDLLSGFWSLLALWQYLRYCRAPEKGQQIGHYLSATLALALALLAKPSAVMVPLMAGLLGGLLLKRPWRRVLGELSPWLLCAVPVIMVTSQAQAWVAHVYKPPIWQRFLIAGDALSFYLAKLLLPLNLGPDYGRLPELVLTKEWVYLTGIIPYLLALVLFWKLPRPGLTAAGLFLLPLLPVLGLQPFAFQAISTVADRYLYLAMLGPALAAALMYSHYQRQKIFALLLVALLVLLAGQSAIQTRYWKNPFVFEAHAIQVNPQSWNAYLRYGVSQSLDNHKEDALASLKQALVIKPDFADAYYNLGVVYSDLGQKEQALAAYQQTLYLSPGNVPAALGLGDLYRESGQYDRAIMYYRIAVDNDPTQAEYHVRLGESYALAAREREALGSFRQAIALQPNYAEAHYRLGAIYQQRREYDQAITSYRTVLQLRPDSAESYNNLGIIFQEQGKVTEAAASFQQAIAISPGLASAAANLKLLQQMHGTK